jgi:hypothetical protein
VPRRVSLPGASELFRPTQAPDSDDVSAGSGRVQHAPETPEEIRKGSGRVRHDEKITVYVSSEELLALERARLTLRADHGMAVDRGRIVREAISAVIADLHRHGAGSELVRRLSAP